jgi:NADPH:quinone reductase-like Zn-dependent oxidoreductase
VYYAGSITRPGGNSEFHLVDERIVGRKPTSLDFAEAAALPLTGITAWEALYDRLGISKDADQNAGKTILIIGAAGGVGSIATQLAKHAGLSVIGTASRPDSVKWVKELGADAVINHFEPFVPQLQALGYSHVDYIFCLNTTEKHWKNMIDAIAPQGKICSIVETDEPVNISLLQQKSSCAHRVRKNDRQSGAGAFQLKKKTMPEAWFQIEDKLPHALQRSGSFAVEKMKIKPTHLSRSAGRSFLHSQIASFFRFIAANVSIACMVTFRIPRKVVHRMPCFSFKSANTRSIVSFRCS